MSAYDAWGNLKTDFTGTVSFLSNDPMAQLPSNYTFTPADEGAHTFPGSAFTLKTAGPRTISARSGVISNTSTATLVTSGPIADFNIFVSPTQIAGEAFDLNVSNAKDAFGNTASGTIVVNPVVGGNPAPNGQVPIFTRVPVINGAGNALQTLMRVEGVVLIGNVEGTGISRQTATITVIPNALADFVVSGYPTVVNSKAIFPNPITVIAYDRLRNEKIDFTWTNVEWQSTEPNSADPDYLIPVISSTNSSRYTFSSNEFVLVTPGFQKIWILDRASGVSDTSGFILVNPKSNANLQVQSTVVSEDTIRQGDSGIQITSLIGNNPGDTNSATAQSVVVEFRFFNSEGFDVSNHYLVVPDPNNSVSVNGGATETFRFLLTVQESAPPGAITLTQKITYRDANTGNTKITEKSNVAGFLVIPGSKIVIQNITPSQSSVTTNQTAPWTVRVAVKNEGGSPATISFNPADTYILFRNKGTNVTPSYTINHPTELEGGGAIVPPNGTKNIVFTINKVGPTTGEVSIYSQVKTVNGAVFTSYSKQPEILGFIVVQEPSNLQIQSIASSQETATRGDNTRPWTIEVRLQNTGGSEVQIDFQQTSLILDKPTGFTIQKPTSMPGFGSTLQGGKADKLVFTVTQTGTSLGAVLVGAQVVYKVINTNETKTVNSTQNHIVVVQEPSQFQITHVRASQSGATIGTTPQWHVAVGVENDNDAGTGADVNIDLATLNATWLRFYRDNIVQSNFTVEKPTQLAGAKALTLKAGARDSLIFPVKTMSNTSGLYEIRAKVTAIEINRNKAFGDSTFDQRADQIAMQSPAQIVWEPNSLSPKTVSPNTNVAFQVSVRNTGEATVILNPAKTTFGFNEGDKRYLANLDETYGVSIPGGAVRALWFQVKYLGSFQTGNSYPPLVVLEGTENNNPYRTEFTLTSDPVIIGQIAELAISYIQPDLATVTVGQTKPWYIAIGLTNNGNASIKLDSARITFNSNISDVSSEFSLQYPTVLENGRAFLSRNSSSELKVKVNAVSEIIETGQILLSAQVWMTDSVETSRQITDLRYNLKNIRVQAPAELALMNFTPGQTGITRGQTTPWYLTAHLQNDGESALRFLPNPPASKLTFSVGNNLFLVQPPTSFLAKPGLVLAGGDRDSIRFVVTNVPSSLPLGAVQINAEVTMQEINTDRILARQTTTPVSVIVQDSSAIRLDEFIVDVRSDSFVNVNQDFYLKARVTNTGSVTGETAAKATITITSQFGHTLFPNGFTTEAVNIPPGASRWTEPGLLVKANNLENVRDLLHARIVSATGRNTGLPMTILQSRSAKDTMTVVRTEQPGNLLLERIFASKDTVTAGTLTPWRISLVIRNNGQGGIFLKQPEPNDISTDRTGFIIEPPVLQGEDAILRGGEIDTVSYTVKTTSPFSGQATITARLRAEDLNDLARNIPPLFGQVKVLLTSTARVRISETFVDPNLPNVDVNGIGLVNTAQVFNVFVRVSNNGAQPIDTAKVRLNAPISLITSETTATVTQIDIGEFKDVMFTLQADAFQNLVGETFIGSIVRAVGEDGAAAVIAKALDSLATVKIYNPARLQIITTTNLAPNPTGQVSMNQAFDVAVVVKNLGTESAKDLQVSLVPQKPDFAVVAQTPKTRDKILASGDTAQVVFRVSALGNAGPVEFVSSIVQVKGLNTNLPAQILSGTPNDRITAVIERPANMTIPQVHAAVREINAGDKRDPWQLFVSVRNSGDASLRMIDISPANIKFSVSGVEDNNYDVRPPQKFKNSAGLILTGNKTDTLIYVINENGQVAGRAKIDVQLKAQDINIGVPSLLTASGTDSVDVNTEAIVQIVQTKAMTTVTDGNGAGLVNRNQNLKINVDLRTGQLLGVDSVYVQLLAKGSSQIPVPIVKVNTIPRDSRASATFTINADNTWDAIKGEITEAFHARILSALSTGTKFQAQIRAPEKAVDSIAVVRIQNPADLDIDVLFKNPADTILATSSEFTVVARVKNRGTAQVNGGSVRLTPPTGYTIFVKDDLDLLIPTPNPVELPFALGDGQKFADLEFLMRSPAEETPGELIRGDIVGNPIDLNSGDPPQITDASSEKNVVTKAEQISIDSFAIVTPAGATDAILSTGQNFTLRAVVRATANLKNRRVTLSLPALPGGLAYQSVSDLTSLVLSYPATIEWTVRAPLDPVSDEHDLSLRLSATSSTAELTREANFRIKRVQQHANLFLNPLEVSSPSGVMQNGEAYTAIGQVVTLRTRVTNNGEAEVSGFGRIRLDLLESGFSLLSGTLEKDFTVDQNLEWIVQAPASVQAVREIRASIVLAPEDANTGLKAQISKGNSELRVHTEDAGFVAVTSVGISSPSGAIDREISTEQTFEVSAAITSARVRSDQTTARINFSNQAFLITNPDITNIATGENRVVKWQVSAPSTASPSDSIWVTVSSKDLRSGATRTATSAKVMVKTVLQTTFAIVPKISFPNNLIDQVSTGQIFELSAQVQHTGAQFTLNDNFIMELSRPSDYVLLSNQRVTTPGDSIVAGRYPRWRLKAPEDKPATLSSFTFTVSDVPTDINTGKEGSVKRREINFTMQTVSHASVALVSYLGEQTTTDSASVRLGRIFEVKAFLRNSGDAGLEGSFQVGLELPKTGYSTEDDLVKTGVANGILSWRIRAPQFVTNPTDTIHFKLLQAPLDQYSKEAAQVLGSQAKLKVTLEAGMLAVKSYKVRTTSSVLKGGLNVPILGLEFRNKDLSSGARSILKGLTLSLQDRKGEPLNPASVLTKLAAVRHNDYNQVFASATTFSSDGKIQLDFTTGRIDTVRGSRPDSIDLIVDIATAAKTIDFQLRLDSTSAVLAFDESGYSLAIADSLNRPVKYLGFASSVSYIVEESFKDVFCNFPNPFGRPDDPHTKFLYYLKNESDVKIHIYTLTGDLVKTWDFTKAEHPLQTSAGVHEGEVIWDGRNGNGEMVLNGIYLAYIITGEGETAMTKIAVVR